MFGNYKKSLTQPKIAGGMELLLTFGFLLLFFLSGSGIFGSIIQAAAYLMILTGVYIVSDVNIWMKRAYWCALVALGTFCLTILMDAVQFPIWVKYLVIFRMLICNVAVLMLLLCLYYGVSELCKEHGLEHKRSLLWSAVLLFIYYLFTYGYQILSSALLYMITVLGGMLIFVTILILLYLGLKEFATLPLTIPLKGRKKIFLRAGGAVLAAMVLTALVSYQYSKVEPSKTQQLSAVKTDAASEARVHLNNLGIPKEVTDLLNDEEASRYEQAVSAQLVQPEEFTDTRLKEDENGEVNGETEKIPNYLSGEEEETQQEKSDSDSAQKVFSIESAACYVVDLGNGDSRVLIHFKPEQDKKELEKHREGVFVSVKATSSLDMTDVNGHEVYKDKEASFSVFDANIDGEKRFSEKLYSFGAGSYDETNYNATDKNANFLAVQNSQSGEKVGKEGYVAFTIKGTNSVSQKIYISMKYIAQTGTINYPYKNIEEYLVYYGDGYRDSQFQTMKKHTWQLNTEE